VASGFEPPTSRSQTLGRPILQALAGVCKFPTQCSFLHFLNDFQSLRLALACSRLSLGIPAKPNAESGIKSEQHSGMVPKTIGEHSGAGNSIVQEVFGFVKRNLSEAQRRKNAASGERGALKGATALVPASTHSGPERDSAPNRESLLAD
jgi:hypothetical protein